MADTKLLNLPDAGTLTGAEYYYAVQGGIDVKVLGSRFTTDPVFTGTATLEDLLATGTANLTGLATLGSITTTDLYLQDVGVAGTAQIITTTKVALTLYQYGNNAAGGTFSFLKTRNSAVGGNTAIQSGDNLGGINYFGSDGTDGARAAWIRCLAEGTIGLNSVPGRLSFGITLTGGTDATESFRMNSSGQFLAYNSTGGIGYGTGAGGSVPQTGSKSTGVTLDKICGEVVMEATTNVNAGSSVAFTCTNSTVGVNDAVLVWVKSATTSTAWQASATRTSVGGSFGVIVQNVSASNLAEGITIGFLVLKASNS